MSEPPGSFTSFTFRDIPEVNEIIEGRREWQRCSFTSFTSLSREGYPMRPPVRGRTTLPYLQNEVNEVNKKEVSLLRLAILSFTSPRMQKVNGVNGGAHV